MFWAIAEDHPARPEAVRQFERLMVDDGERFFFQPCFSPVWDTAIALYALGEAGAASRDAPAARAADWLLAKEIRRKGDWSVKRPNTEPSGWAFEFDNDFYPDIDDTAMVMLGLAACAGVRSGGAAGLPSSGRSTGCSPCSRRTAAGRRSTSTTTGNS